MNPSLRILWQKGLNFWRNFIFAFSFIFSSYNSAPWKPTISQLVTYGLKFFKVDLTIFPCSNFHHFMKNNKKFVSKWWVSILFINIWKYWFSVQSPKSKYYFWVVMHRNIFYTTLKLANIQLFQNTGCWTLKLNWK